MDDVLEVVRQSLSSGATSGSSQQTALRVDMDLVLPEANDEEYAEGWEEGLQGHEDYDDLGEGAGIEGDLEMDDE